MPAMEQQTTPSSERPETRKIGPCATRALPRLGDMALKLKSGENGHLALEHAQMGRSMGDIAHLALARANGAFGRRCEPLAGRGGGFGGGAAPVPAHAARGALLQFECLRKTRGVQAFRAWRGRPGRDG